MNTETGELKSEKELLEEGIIKKNVDELKNMESKFIKVEIGLTPEQIKNRKIGRNDICPCGSGKKFKNCHLKLTEQGR